MTTAAKTDTKELSLTVERHIAAAPEAVFDAWLNAETLARCMCPGPDMGPANVTNDPVEGGDFRIVMTSGDQEIPHTGTYQRIDRPNRLMFTWQSPFSIDGSTVTLDFAKKGNGTQVKLTQVKFENAELRDQHRGGWTSILEKFADDLG